MITEDRKEELVSMFAAYLERYLDKQWIDDDAKQNTAETDEELKFLREQVTYSVVTYY
jgi:hypothetical protein